MTNKGRSVSQIDAYLCFSWKRILHRLFITFSKITAKLGTLTLFKN